MSSGVSNPEVWGTQPRKEGRRTSLTLVVNFMSIICALVAANTAEARSGFDLKIMGSQVFSEAPESSKTYDDADAKCTFSLWFGGNRAFQFALCRAVGDTYFNRSYLETQTYLPLAFGHLAAHKDSLVWDSESFELDGTRADVPVRAFHYTGDGAWRCYGFVVPFGVKHQGFGNVGSGMLCGVNGTPVDRTLLEGTLRGLKAEGVFDNFIE